MSTFVGASLQYLALVLGAAALWMRYRMPGLLRAVGDGRIIALVLVVLFLAGTVIRLLAGRADRPSVRRSLLTPRPGATQTALAQDDVSDASRTITPAMLHELRNSRPWIGGFSIFLGIAGGVSIAAGCIAMIITELSGGGRTAVGIGIGSGLAQVFGGSLILMLFSYVREHYRAIPATGARLSEVQFAAIVDSQRRVVRFFGTMLLMFAALVVTAFVAGVVIGMMR